MQSFISETLDSILKTTKSFENAVFILPSQRAKVFLKPASEGTGVIAGGAVRSVLESLGVQDVLSKSQGSSNPHNVVKATFDALLRLRNANTVASQRGISLNKVF